MKKPKHITKADWEDLDSPPLTDEIMNLMLPVKNQHPKTPRRVRGVQKAPTRIPVSIHLSPQVVEFFKSKGKGWQTLMNEALLEYVKSH